jgi:hypothetical protein
MCEEVRNPYRILVESLDRKRPLEGISVDGRLN